MKNNCKPSSKNCSKIIGAIFLIGGTGLTLATNSDAGILGLLIAGALLCIKPSSGCSPCGGCGSCGCCCGCLPEKNSIMEAHCGEPTLPTKKVVKTAAKPRKAKKPA